MKVNVTLMSCCSVVVCSAKVVLLLSVSEEDQKVYTCGDTLLSFGFKVDYTADWVNSLVLTGIDADTHIVLR